VRFFYFHLSSESRHLLIPAHQSMNVQCTFGSNTQIMKKFLPLCILCFVLRLNAQIDTFTVPAPAAWSPITVKTMLADNAGNVWFSHSGGLRKYDGTTWTFYQTTNSGLPSNVINSIVQDNAGLYWIATSAGLVKFDGSNWTTYSTSNSGLDTNVVNCLAAGSNTDLWIGTPKGFQKFDGTNWISYNISNSAINSNRILSLAFSGNNLYIGTVLGLSTLNASGIQNHPPLYNLGEIVVSGTEVWLRNPSGVYRFENGNYVSFNTSADFCYGNYQLIGTNSGGLSITQGVYGGFTCISGQTGSQGLMNYSTGNVVEIDLQPIVISKLIRAGNFYYLIATISGSKRLLRIDATQYGPPQTPASNYYSYGNCNEQDLDINQVQALVLDRGDMFWDIGGSRPKYEVPKGSGSTATFAGSVWLGGKVNGQLRTACQTYRQAGVDFWPGPLDTVTAINPPWTGSGPVGPVFKVNRFDIENFIFNFANGNVQSGNFTPSYGILHWPANDTGNFSRNTAPYTDVNGNGVYDPLTGGDYPAIKGDQTVYTLYNDASDAHTETGSPNALGIEVRQRSYAYTCPGIADSMRALNYTTFYEYEIINRSSNMIDSMYIAFWNDVDLGNYNDDYIGCNVTENYGYVYNGDNFDDDANGVIGYHNYPPCFSTAILQSPPAIANDGKDNDHDGLTDEAGEEAGMSSFMGYANNADPYTGNPLQSPQYYNYMRGVWRNGSPVKYGGDGVTGTLNTTYAFPGSSDPIGYGLGGNPGSPNPQPSWTEVSGGNLPGDRRMVIGSGPFQLAAKDTAKLIYALVFTQDSTAPGDNIGVIAKNEQQVKQIRRWYTNNSFPSCLDLSAVGIKTQTKNELAARMYPNPASIYITIETEELQDASVDITDILGQPVLNTQLKTKAETLNVEQLTSGIYFVNVKSTKGRKTFKLVVSR
jgi:hypothetical protein